MEAGPRAVEAAWAHDIDGAIAAAAELASAPRREDIAAFETFKEAIGRSEADERVLYRLFHLPERGRPRYSPTSTRDSS